MAKIQRAKFPKDEKLVLDIYRDYVNSTSASLDFQNNESEFSNLEGKYNKPGAGIFLAWQEARVVGCAAFRQVDNDVCEMKRVYVRPCSRGMQLGFKLVKRVLDEAAAHGYKKMCLDVLPEFDAALRLYQSFGFVPDDPVTYNPVPGTAFLGIDLRTYSQKMPLPSK